MKSNDPDDHVLSSALRSWKVSQPLPPGFQDQVWRRIERAEVLKRRSWFAEAAQFLDRAFARPALAYAYVLLFLGIGLTGGYVKAHQQENRIETQLAARYVQSIDPYHKTGH